jgi:hypothetical protein
VVAPKVGVSYGHALKALSVYLKEFKPVRVKAVFKCLMLELRPMGKIAG